MYLAGPSGEYARRLPYWPERGLFLDRTPSIALSGPRLPNSQAGSTYSLDLTHVPGLGCLSTPGGKILQIKLPSPNYLTKIVGTFNIEEVTSLLRHCHHLRELEWCADFDRSDRAQESQLEELSKANQPLLQHLSFFVQSQDESQILHSISAPQLQSLSLTSDNPPAENQFPNLERLYLDDVFDGGVVAVIQSTPSINTLVLRYCDKFSVMLLQALIERDDQGAFVLLPALRGLSLE